MSEAENCVIFILSLLLAKTNGVGASFFPIVVKIATRNKNKTVQKWLRPSQERLPEIIR